MELLGSLLPLILLVLIVWALVMWRRKHPTREQPGPGGETPYGVSGWLALFVYSTLFLSPLFIIGRTSNELRGLEIQYPELAELSNWRNYKVYVWCYVAAMVAWCVWVALQLKTKWVPRSVFHAKLLIVGTPVLVGTLETLAAKFFFDDWPGPEFFGSLIGGLLASMVWFLYFVRSKRVRNTYQLATKAPAVSPVTAATPAAAPTPAAPFGGTFGTSTATAASPAVSPAVSSASSTASLAGSAAAGGTLEERLARLRHMHEQGLISQVDFEAKKAELLAQL